MTTRGASGQMNDTRDPVGIEQQLGVIEWPAQYSVLAGSEYHC